MTKSADRDRQITEAVEASFRSSRRDLPWRAERSGYAALVSEAMLQQTQVARVVEKYVEFMRRFPTVRALAEASEQAVLAAWQGLGYYGRARRLQAAAREIVARHGGDVPREVDALRALPGIGRYTAGAIASIAFGERAPIVDTNVARVLMRLDARGGTATSAENIAWTWTRAAELVAACHDPATFNEGLMELGASTCAAARPRCDRCPLASVCAARKRGDADAIPEAPRSPARRRVYHHSVVVLRGTMVLLVQRPERGLWASMWQVPTIEADERLASDDLRAALALPCSSWVPLEEFTHLTSHREVVFVCHRARTRVRAGTWVDADRLSEFPLSNPMRRIVAAALSSESHVAPIR